MTIMSENIVRKSLARGEREIEEQIFTEKVRTKTRLVKSQAVGRTDSADTGRLSVESTESNYTRASEQLVRIQQLRTSTSSAGFEYSRPSTPFAKRKSSVGPIVCKTRLTQAIERLSSYNDRTIRCTLDRWRFQSRPNPDPHLNQVDDTDTVSLISPTYPGVPQPAETIREPSFTHTLYQQSRTFNSSYHGITGSSQVIGTGTSGTTSSGGASKPEKRKSSIALTPEDESIERSLMDVKFPTVLPPNPQLKALLVFHKSDNICEVVTEACHRQQLDVTVARTKEGALDTLTNTNEEFYHLIIIDARSTKHLDAEYIARSIRHTNGHHFTTIIAVVKKSFFEKDDVLIALLDAGVNRCVPETTNLSMCNIELKQILHSIVRPHNVMSTQQALYTALHRLKEVILITDNHLRIQYANRAAERLLNMRMDEIISKPLADIFISDVSTIMIHGRKNKEFDEILTVRRKGQEDVAMHVRVIPVACIGRTPTHYVFNLDVPGSHGDFVATLPQAREAPRGSQHSIRRGSVDVRSVASDGLRRTSLAKLTSLPLEAPITKIINLLSQVQENCSPDEARLIDKVMEFLKREGLYSPQMKEIRTDDPIATDLIGALLTGPSLYSSRRSSNDSIIRVGGRQSTCMPAKMKATPHIMELLEESLSWEFDIFKLEEITEKRPLLYLGMEMFRRFNVFATLNIDENVCKSWLAVIEANYHANNSYHNSTHAADVMQATGCFLTQLAAKDMGMDRTDEAIALIAAAAHDVDHPGRSSAFLCNSRNTLALLYNDLCVLESHHASITFRLTLSDDKVNIFKNLDTESYKSVRSVVIDMILATEMTRHFEHLAKFVSIFGSDEEPKDIVQSEEESSILIRRMMIKVADVSNPSRQPSYCIEWARRIAEEYFTQTDEEKAKTLPIVMPMFDRNTCSIPKSQIGFIEYIIQDMMHAWDSFIDMPQLVTYMQINYSQWKKFEDQGVHTLADVKSKQHSLSVKKSAK
ncbi:high affinity cAMP-specific and IBMX-insensitive 3',5'-cyclic phosphodiesterase 8 isoform X2 [Zeugodacus cucurbitae]|uniref:high affinity cAMP-specific and IBMX-insensitive 3',5'-cyclic phosphodiesterase 8 isoform X2 n=2 Tax=Zeugodacus cucurbitae TaxID=28588 RepID=UPI0023D93DBB|nr:high affinity cAMP-specific and IBMX-insensitive 3',5'-cyclic phosphodiesterase 8 isoform X2 [Zeugodacus cucurbitae]